MYLFANRMRIFYFISILLLSNSCVILAQQQIGSWNILNVKQDLNKSWNLFTEAQIRSIKFYHNFHYYEYKAGLQYTVNQQSTFSFGVGKFDTYQITGNFKNPKSNNELRTWLQFTLKNNINTLTIDHRYRAEQRFTSNGYRNRFRYRVSLLKPIKINKAEIGVYANNEIFFTNNAPYFERNRFSIGLQKKWNTNITTQLAFLNQFDYKINDETGRNFFQISFLFNNLFALKMKQPNKQTNNLDSND